MSYLELRVLVVLELEWFSSSESDSSVLTDSFRAQPAAEPTPCALFLAGRGREALVPCAESPVPVLAALLAGDHWVAGAGSGSAVSAVLVMMTLLSWLITITVVMLPPLLSSSVVTNIQCAVSLFTCLHWPSRRVSCQGSGLHSAPRHKCSAATVS